MDATMIPLILALPLAVAAVAAVLERRPRVAALVGAGGAFAVWLALLLSGAAAKPIVYEFAGRALTLDASVRESLLITAAALTLICLLAAVRSVRGPLIAPALALFAPLAVAFMVDSLSLGAVFLLMAIAFAVPAVYGGRYEAAAAAWRWFLMSALAVALLVLVDSPLMADQAGSVTARLALLGASLLLLGGLPFHIWIGGLSRHTRPLGQTLALGLLYGAVAVFAVGVLEDFPQVRTAAEFQTAVRWSAALTALLAGLLMLRAGSWREAMGSALLLDTGFLLLTLIMPVAAARETALLVWVGRVVVLLLFAAAIDLNASVKPLRRRALLLGYACVALIGLPLTPLYAARWTALSYALPGGAGGFPWVALLLAAATALATLGVLRAARRLSDVGVRDHGDRIQTAAVTFIVLLTLLLSILPRIVINS